MGETLLIRSRAMAAFTYPEELASGRALPAFCSHATGHTIAQRIGLSGVPQHLASPASRWTASTSPVRTTDAAHADPALRGTDVAATTFTVPAALRPTCCAASIPTPASPCTPTQRRRRRHARAPPARRRLALQRPVRRRVRPQHPLPPPVPPAGRRAAVRRNGLGTPPAILQQRRGAVPGTPPPSAPADGAVAAVRPPMRSPARAGTVG